jgi:hypothetical protein
MAASAAGSLPDGFPEYRSIGRNCVASTSLEAGKRQSRYRPLDCERRRNNPSAAVVAPRMPICQDT